MTKGRAALDKVPIAQKLREAPGVKSLEIEQEVARALRKHKWHVHAGIYFKDPSEKKYRELDVMATRSWKAKKARRRKSRKNEIEDLAPPSATLSLLVECKSLTDYHVVFGEPCSPKVLRLSTWPGYFLDDEKWKLVEGIRRFQMKVSEPMEIWRKINQAAFPGESTRTAKLTVDPPELPNYSSSFRETKPGAERDLDSSVLWKAYRELRAAFESYRLAAGEGCMENIVFSAKTARYYDEDPLDWALHACRDETNTLRLYHPIVVLDARLWKLVGKRLTEIPYARLIQSEGGLPSGGPMLCIERTSMTT